MKLFSTSIGGLIWGALIGLIGSFVALLALAGLLDIIFPAGPGPGAAVFYLSWVLSPMLGILGGAMGARIGRKRMDSERTRGDGQA